MSFSGATAISGDVADSSGVAKRQPLDCMCQWTIETPMMDWRPLRWRTRRVRWAVGLLVGVVEKGRREGGREGGDGPQGQA